jgi:hypothetical protein
MLRNGIDWDGATDRLFEAIGDLFQRAGVADSGLEHRKGSRAVFIVRATLTSAVMPMILDVSLPHSDWWESQSVEVIRDYIFFMYRLEGLEKFKCIMPRDTGTASVQ